MDEVQLNEILTSYRDAINALIERADAQDGMINAIKDKSEHLEHLVYDEVINPAKEAMNQAVYDAGLKDFSDRYNDKLGGYSDSLKAIEGEDFDIMKQAYDGYNAIEGDKPEEDKYVEELVKSIDAQLNDIRTKLGVPADSEVVVKQDEEGTKVEVDGKEVETEEVIEKDETEESNKDELAEFEKELLAYKN